MAAGDSFDMQRMQEEAVKRAREMQRRSQMPIGAMGAADIKDNQGGAGFQTEEREGKSNHAKGDGDKTPPPASGFKASAGTGFPPPARDMPAPVSMLDSLFKDKDQSLILMLLVLIGGEKESRDLMFALLFLLM